MLVKTAAASAKYSSIAIIGGGIGGLTAANAFLFRKNLVGRVSIYEQASHFIPTAGAGFGFSPNGQICLSSIGINGYHRVGHPFDRLARIDKSGRVIQQESQVFRELRQRHGFGFSGCLRADIVELLVEGLNKQKEPVLNYNHRLTKITPIQDKVELEFNDGEHQDVVDLVIGADGIHSTVAKQLNIDDEIPPLYSGANIVYGKIPQPSTIDYFQSHPIFTPHSVVNGPGTGEFIAFTAGSRETQQFIWATTYASSKPPQRQEQDEWNEAPQSAKELLQQDVFSNYPSGHPLHDFYEMTKDEDVLHFGLYYRHHKKSWSNDRVVLLGDACHATLPYVGQGANQAIEDAVYLAACLDKQNDYNAAYEDFYRRRFPRTKRVVQMAGIMHKLYHSESWILQGTLEYLLKSVMKGGFILKQIENEIIKECPVQDYQRYAPKP